MEITGFDNPDVCLLINTWKNFVYSSSTSSYFQFTGEWVFSAFCDDWNFWVNIAKFQSVPNNNIDVDFFSSSLKRNQNEGIKLTWDSFILSKWLVWSEQRIVRSRDISLRTKIFVWIPDSVTDVILSNLTRWVTLFLSSLHVFFSRFKL